LRLKGLVVVVVTQFPKAKFGTKIHQSSITDFQPSCYSKNTTLQFPRWKQDNTQALSSIRYQLVFQQRKFEAPKKKKIIPGTGEQKQ
jgi:hypothetical protein